MTLLIHIIATVLGITGAVLLTLRKPVACQITWSIWNACWITWCIIQRDPLTGLTFSVYLVLSVAGVINWCKEKKNAKR